MIKLGKMISFKTNQYYEDSIIYNNVNRVFFNALQINDWDDLLGDSIDITAIAAKYVGRNMDNYVIEKDESWF